MPMQPAPPATRSIAAIPASEDPAARSAAHRAEPARGCPCTGMIAPAHSLRVVFALSTLMCSLILVLFVRGRVSWTPEFWIQLVAAAILTTAAICVLAFRRGRLRLEAVPLARLVPLFLRQLLFTYIASAVTIAGIAAAVVFAVTRSGPDALALAVLAGSWLALWLAPAIACVTSWKRLHRHVADAGTA